MSSTLDWVSSLRTRLGYLVIPNLMLYGTAGGALGKIEYAASNSGGAIPFRPPEPHSPAPRAAGLRAAGSSG
jgi:hypothetical protein